MDTTEFINNLKRDKARGVIAPHQIVLLIAFYNIYKKRNSTILNIEEINYEFQKVWKENSCKFKSKSNLVGMPLKALYNQGHITINLLNNIIDFRKVSDLKKNIQNVILSTKLTVFLKNEELIEKLFERFDR